MNIPRPKMTPEAVAERTVKWLSTIHAALAPTGMKKGPVLSYPPPDVEYKSLPQICKECQVELRNQKVGWM